MKKTVSWLLLLVMLFTSQVSFASVEVKFADLVTAQTIDENSLLLNENGKVSKIVQEETPSGLITTVFDYDSGEISKFVRNDDAGTTTVSSSLTQERITLLNSTDVNTYDYLSEDRMDSNPSAKISLNSGSASIGEQIRYMSYRTLGLYILGSATTAKVVAALANYYQLPLVTVVATIVANLMGSISIGLMAQSSDTGLAVYSRLYTITKHQGGGTVTFQQRKIYKVSTY